ncbi:hypothetical protein E4631_07515 [Hymenobacter sp. UV11]|uniref:hypothetical protein n=1 Tax=Hymenobacter sp. UV11 TaxID=1849735 RepID=UPI00105EA951|nr:hypothetical protein [Hymenobacter sp. UV11]TDN36118.1 hypothetical protein A8B98_09225 [Hymenobacter sp. UV11]TFZ66811.1 hypothetical protein E4631_07515 [Hymenobacter sp. UV11]
MTEPTNPLFEDEKDFLMRKKLEYERALRGDVQEIKEQTVQAGKVALIGAGVVSGVWLLVKAFSGRKPKKKHKKHHRPSFEDYSGFDSFDENDQELSELATDFQATDYTYDEDGNYVPVGGDDGFYYHSTSDSEEDLDDNGLGQESDFPAHSSATHGFDTDATEDAYHVGEDHGQDEGPEDGYASPNSFEAHPYDDSRRISHSEQFEEPTTEEQQATPSKPSKKLGAAFKVVGPALLAFAKSETGRVVVAQAAAVALAMVTKVVQDIMPKDADETSKNADLAASSATKGAQPVAWPATSAAQDATAAAHHDDTLTASEPLA